MTIPCFRKSRRLRSLCYASLDREIEEKLLAHLELLALANRTAGMGPGAAWRDDRLRFGNIIAAREQVKAMDAPLGVENLFAISATRCRGSARSLCLRSLPC